MEAKMFKLNCNVLIIVLTLVICKSAYAQYELRRPSDDKIDTMGFWDSAHHWYSIHDEDHIISPLPGQERYKIFEITKIADNVLLFQKANGGWAKNYDMLAVLSEEQKRIVAGAFKDTNTTLDNGTTHSQVEYLARAFEITRDARYKDASLRGMDFMLSAQYGNGGWPQFYPDTSGYRKYITFNDGAMAGVMKVLLDVIQNKPYYSFVDDVRRDRARKAFARGVDCILKCQIVQAGSLSAWGQQHDNVDFRPRDARTFEPASISGGESAEIVLLLMRIDQPSKDVIQAVQSAVRWFDRSKLFGIRVKEISAPTAHFIYHTTSFDRIVVADSMAPPIWARLYELGTNRPLFCNRDRKPVYSLAEVERERRTGYSWYTYAPEEVLRTYPDWQRRWALLENVMQK